MTNKYAEGYPGRRYYGGCQFVDIAEELAIERACRLFDCKFANVQPNSGSQANQAVFMALMKPGDTFMGLDLACGGHLTHGSPVNMSGKWFNVVSYKVREDDQIIDMDEVARARPRAQAEGDRRRRLGLFAVLGFRALPRDRRRGRRASSWSTWRISPGLVAGGAHPSPFPHAHVVTTTTHKTLRGPRGGMILTNDEDIAKKINSAIFPGLQGGPLMHVIAAKAVAFGEALRPEFKLYARAVVDNAKALADTMLSNGYAIVAGGTDNHLMLVDLRPKRPDRQGGRSGARPRAHHLQQERRAVRSREADGDLRHPPRHAGRDLARLRRRRVQDGRRADRRDPRRPCEERRRMPMARVEESVKQRAHELTRRFPIYA